MGVRGRGYAAGRGAHCDENGRPLPSDRFTRYVAVELVCKVCERSGGDIVLGMWAVESSAREFSPDQVFDMGDNRAVELQVVTEGDVTRTRFTSAAPAAAPNGLPSRRNRQPYLHGSGHGRAGFRTWAARSYPSTLFPRRDPHSAVDHVATVPRRATPETLQEPGSGRRRALASSSTTSTPSSDRRPRTPSAVG